MNVIYRKAVQKDIPELKKLWIDTFEEDETAVEIFFNSILPYTTVYCAEADEKIVSAVYLISCTLNEKKAHYLCGASTDKSYRKKGIMSSLIKYALDECLDEYSVLFPASNDLYSFYEKFGYVVNCTAKKCVISRQQLMSYNEENKTNTTDNILLWNNKFREFAEKYYSHYGVSVLKNKEAIIFADEKENHTEIFYSDYSNVKAFKSLILDNFSTDKFILTLKTNDENFDGETIKYGMIKSLKNEKNPQEVYIGITLN